MVDWDLVKFQYEMFHEPVEVLAEENQVSAKMIRIAINEKGWKRAPVRGITEIKDLKDIDEFTDEVMTQMKGRLDVMSLVKLAALNPRYIALETAIIKKAMEITQSILPGSPQAADALQKIAGVLEKLGERNAFAKAKNEAADGESSGITVQILNQIEAAQPNP